MMTLYANIGAMEYYSTPRQAVPVVRRERWEFIACLDGEIRLDLPRMDHDEVLRGRTLWCLPAQHPHGWLSDAPCLRALFPNGRWTN